MVSAAAKGRTLMGGTKAMRGAAKTYLPQFEAESDKAYKARLDSSWLFNGYKKTVRDMTGRVFEKPVELGEDTPDAIKGWAQDVDMAGRDLSAFAKDVFEKGFDAGVSYIMVDAPRRDVDVTINQARAQNLRPFLVHLKVEDVLGWKSESVDNVTRLTMLRISETISEPDPKDEFSELPVAQVRVLDLPTIDGVRASNVRVRIYQELANTGWTLVEEYTTQAEEITVVPFYAARTGFFTGEPVLDDLADVNIAHWQSQSDQRNILHFARVPFIFGAGYDDDNGNRPLKFSAGMAVSTLDPNAKLSWVEHSGASIGAGRQDLKDLEFQMETFGLQLLAARAQSATGEALDAVKETSQLAMMADNLKDALEQALFWMADYGGESAAPSVVVNKDFGVSMLTPQELTVMLTAVNTGNMPRRTFVEEMKRRGFVSGDTDTDAYLDELDEEDPGLDDGGE
jgi:hypothetical protein